MTRDIPVATPEAGPAGARLVRVQVLAARPATHDAATFTLAVPGTQRAPAGYRAGQFITLGLPIRGTTYYRSYSLCGAGQPDAPWEITVKRTRGGLCSNVLVDQLRPGAMLRASLPQGTFTLADTAWAGTPLIFVAAGSGITPICSMLRALARREPAQRPRVELHYAYHSPADAIFGRELAALDPERVWLTQQHYVASSGQRLTAARVVAAAGAEAARAEWFICGPAELKRDVEAEALRCGVPEARIHAEVFASPAARGRRATSSRGEPARVRLADSGATFAALTGETVLATLERHGYRPDFSCRAGACGTCRLRLLAGEVHDGAGQSGALTPDERCAGDILSCVAQPLGDITLASAGAPVAAPGRSASAAPTSARYAGGGRATRRGAAKRSLRLGLAAAAVGLFAATWGLTSHGTFTQTASAAASTTSSSSTSTSTSTSSSAASSSGTSSTSGTNGSSSFTTQTGQTSANTSTGVS